ncbi:MAG: DUF45 domain-containing protein, partial [Burkholderiaceae bacterium]|nr:DUF45 domain-containing protein [Burkholderiaceae bacterium]
GPALAATPQRRRPPNAALRPRLRGVGRALPGGRRRTLPYAWRRVASVPGPAIPAEAAARRVGEREARARPAAPESLPGDPEPERVKAPLRRWYLDRARTVFSDVLGASLLHFKHVEHPRLIVRAMQSRRGGLSHAGTMTLNVNLVRAPRPCIEYVVTHELCHTRHRDHDAGFSKLPGQVMPDRERRKQRLDAALL